LKFLKGYLPIASPHLLASDIVRALILVQEIIRRKAEPSLVVANTSAWGPGQLEGELDTGTWLTLPARVEHVFWERAEDLWKVVFQEFGARWLSRFLSNREIPLDPILN
jgi:putative transcriptional regulator